MDACTRNQGCQMKPKLSLKKENISEGLLSAVKSLLQSRKELCTIADSPKTSKKGDFIEITFLGLSGDSGAANIQGVAAYHLDIPELIRSLRLCNLNVNEVILLKDGKEATQSCTSQRLFSGAVCMMTSISFPFFKSDSLFVLLSKYTAGVKYAMEQEDFTRISKTDHHEDDDTNQSVSSIEDDFVTAFEHLDEEEPVNSNENQGVRWENVRNQRDAASQTQPAHCLDVGGSKIIFSSVRRRSSIKSTMLMSYVELPQLSSSGKNTVTTSMCNTWKQRTVSSQDKIVLSPSPVESSESDCSSPSPIIFLDEVGYQKSLRAKLNLPKIPVGKDGIEDSDSELSEFFDSFDRFDEPESTLEDHFQTTQKTILASPPKKKKCAKGHMSTVCMNPQKFQFDRPTLSASVKKPTPRKAESPFSSVSDLPDSPRLAKICAEDNGTLFSPIRSSAFSPPGVPTTTDCSHLVSQEDNSFSKFSDYANHVCINVFDSVFNTKPSSSFVKKEQEKNMKHKRKSHSKESDRKLKSKHKSIKGGIQKFAADLVENSLGSAFKDLQRGVSSCTSALCHLAARLTSYIVQMAFYEIGRRRAFSIKKRAINSLANLMVSEVITSALQELRHIKKQMVTNAVTRFAADLAEELVFEGIMEVCQFSHPPTPTVSYCQSFDYEDVAVSSYAKDLSESVIQEAFIELSQVNVSFTTEAAISVSMDNLRYVSSEAMSVQSSPTSTSPGFQEVSPAKSKRDYTVQYALFFTSGLMSSVPVPVAAKVLSQKPISSDTYVYVDNVKKYNLSTKSIAEISGTTIISSSKDGVSNSLQEQQDADGVKAFSVTMVDMIVNEAYDVIQSAKTVEDYAEMMTKKIIERPSLCLSLDGEASQHNCTDGLGKGSFKHTLGRTADMFSNNLDVMKLSRELPINFVDQHKVMPQDTEMLTYSPKSSEQQKRIFRCPQVGEQMSLNPCFIVKQSAQDYKWEASERRSSGSCAVNSNTMYSKTNTEGWAAKRTVQKNDVSDSSLFSIHSCLPHINHFSSVMCNCGEELFVEDKIRQRDSTGIALPSTPPPTPITSYDISPERSMRKLGKRLKGKLAKDFYPATPPSTPHLSVFEHDNTKRDDFMLKLMRSLSEEVESSSSDDSSEELEVSEETCRYADYLSSNIISVATDMAACSLEDESAQGASIRNRSQLSVLSDKWGYPAYMRNITEDLLETMCRYANCVAGEVINDAKEMIGSRKNSMCDVDCGNSRLYDKDCRPKERGYKYANMNFKSTDPATLHLPHYNDGAGLTSKYPSCESVTEEYADHLIRVLKMEGGNSELILDQYAGRLVYSAIKSGLQQASKTTKVKCNRKVIHRVKSEANCSKEIRRLLSRTHHSDKNKRRLSNFTLRSFNEDSVQKSEHAGLLTFAESLAHTITCDVKRKLKMSTASLPKSLTDSCLYTKSKHDYITGEVVKTSYPKTLLPLTPKQKLYHSTGSLNDHGISEGIMQAIEQYACNVVDGTLEFSMEAARLQAAENRKKADKVPHAGKLTHSYGTACRLCSVKEQNGNPVSSCHFLLGQDVSRKTKQCSKSKQNACQKSRLFHLNIPKIHIDFDKRAVLADKIVSAAIEKAERELSNTSLAADSGIGHDGVSFAESLTTEIMMSAMKNIGHVFNISTVDKDGFQSVDSVTSQQTSVSVGDDSTGSWSNLSFEDEHQDESSSFLHLSDSDCTEDKDEEPKVTAEVLEQHCKTLLIRNVDVGPSAVEPQLRVMLQWIAASEAGVSELYFPENAKKELMPLFRQVRERGWKIGDLLQAVLQYCESSEMPSNISNPLFAWLLENC
ncbi:A-kinase anchor protein 11 isoform X2 [Pseudophryne corroboree]|uniref:A-kinase anchor protein 11 isoform X2 n=1 Tax=Pseudophryne corroboree TaxID=495146 RepID=UPI0030820793